MGGPTAGQSHVSASGWARPALMGKGLTLRCSLMCPSLRPGSRVGPGIPLGRVLWILVILTIKDYETALCLSLHVGPICYGRTYQEGNASDNISPKIIRTISALSILYNWMFVSRWNSQKLVLYWKMLCVIQLRLLSLFIHILCASRNYA